MPLKMEAPLSPSPASTLVPPSTEASYPGSFLGLLWDGEAVWGVGPGIFLAALGEDSDQGPCPGEG